MGVEGSLLWALKGWSTLCVCSLKRLPCGALYRTKARSLSISISKFTPRCSQVWMGDFHTSKPNIEALSPTEPNKLCLTQYTGKVSIKSFHCRRNSKGSSAVLTANTPAKKSFDSAKNSVGFWFWALWGSHSWTSTSIFYKVRSRRPNSSCQSTQHVFTT